RRGRASRARPHVRGAARRSVGQRRERRDGRVPAGRRRRARPFPLGPGRGRHRLRPALLGRSRHPRGLRHAGLARARRRGRGREAGLTARIRPAGDPAALQEAAGLVGDGRLVAFPTETVYGLGASALDAAAVARVFEAKGRPSFDPLIVHLVDAGDVSRVAVTGRQQARMDALALRFWPGPLTLVLPKAVALPHIVTAGLETAAVRVPDHDPARALIPPAGTPIA